MNNFKIYHYIVLGIFLSVFGAAGYFAGLVMANPPLPESEREKIIQDLVLEKTGQKPEKVFSLSDEEGELSSLSGNVLQESASDQYYFVQMKEDSSVKSSALESGAEFPDSSNFRMVVVDEKGEVEVKDILF